MPSAIATMVWDVMMKTDTIDPYLKLKKKKKVVERCGESGTLKIRKMVAGESIADMKPNELFCLMKRRAESHIASSTNLF